MTKSLTHNGIIVGAGLAGCCQILSLAQENHDLSKWLWLERDLKPVKSIADCLESRPLSLAASTQHWLASVGLWSQIAPHAQQITAIHISQAGYLGRAHLSAADSPYDALAYVVPAALLQKILFEAATAQRALTYIKRIDSIEPKENLVTLCYTDSQLNAQSTHAQVLIGADGTRSSVLSQRHWPRQSQQKNEYAISANLHWASTLPDTQIYLAQERFTRDGTLAILPRNQKTSGLVWTMPAHLAEQTEHWSETQWQYALQKRLKAIIDQPIAQIKLTGRYPLQPHFVMHPAKDRCILIGNAAHTFYPIAAQGFNLAVRDVLHLTEHWQDARDYGSERICRRYTAARQPDYQSVKQLTNTTASAFACCLPGAGHLRGMALMAIQASGHLQKRIIRQGLGLVGTAPKALWMTTP